MAIDFLSNKKVLLLFSHCDDELICGWPILQESNIEKDLLIASSDRNNKLRSWCQHRKFVTQDICQRLGIGCRILDHPSEFYLANTRDGSLSRFEVEIISTISSMDYDVIFTHNPFGEYGHLDHRLLFQLIHRCCNTPILISDITYKTNWSSYVPSSPRYYKTFYHNEIANCSLNLDFYQEIELFYRSHNVWTWSQEPTSSASLYLI
ncbi:hypothetical protein [Prochlorococcus sp. MIT 1341]|uniref:hypothetical protein n=1 Tax=Prochlorococcus sp. MIT 1341 TaxID=3096221 RepID=UPI002A7568CB|nr:hypothetical protein [Prochlorococcus sp. MIT 1341]